MALWVKGSSSIKRLAVLLARRNLFQDITRLALSITGVALAVMLILLLQGFLDGMYRQIAGYLEHTPGAVVVAQEDVSNLLGFGEVFLLGAIAAWLLAELSHTIHSRAARS